MYETNNKYRTIAKGVSQTVNYKYKLISSKVILKNNIFKFNIEFKVIKKHYLQLEIMCSDMLECCMVT